MEKKYTVKMFSDNGSLEDWLNEHESNIQEFKIAMNHRYVLIVVEWKKDKI